MRSTDLFHSEADFQHALAWEVRLHHPDYRVRLEYRLPEGPRSHADLWIWTPEGAIAIELKYWTRRLQAEVDGETFLLIDQAAQDLSRHDFLKDLQRVERVVAQKLAVSGYVIALTNDRGYWGEPRAGTVDADLRLHEGRSISGVLGWAPHAGAGTTRGREASIEVVGTYPLNWHDYSAVAGVGPGDFRYLLACVAVT